MLKMVLIHENEHHWPNRRKVAFLELECDHFKGLHGSVLRRAVFEGGGWRNVVVGHCFWRGVRAPNTPTPTEASPLRGGIEQVGESCTRWALTAVQRRTGRTRNTTAKRPFKGGEGENHENTGSMAPPPAARLSFCGPSPTKTEPSGCCPLPLAQLKVLPWVVVGAGGLGAGKTSGAGTRGVSLDVVIGVGTGYTNTNGGESSDNRGKVHADCGPAENPSL